MREIKFRAWDKEANIMVYSDHRTRKLYDVYYGFEVNEQGKLECRWEGEWNESQRLDGGTLDNIEQYTGLKDKNGKEIFEGDVIITAKGVTQVITWTDYYSAFVAEIPSGDRPYRIDSSDEIIGNIHENAELSEGEEEK